MAKEIKVCFWVKDSCKGKELVLIGAHCFYTVNNGVKVSFLAIYVFNLFKYVDFSHKYIAFPMCILWPLAANFRCDGTFLEIMCLN